MKFLTTIIVITILPAMAFADDFGERFHSQAPAGLEQNDEAFTTEALDLIAQEEFRPELIEPAAGDEYFDSEADPKNSPENSEEPEASEVTSVPETQE